MVWSNLVNELGRKQAYSEPKTSLRNSADAGPQSDHKVSIRITRVLLDNYFFQNCHRGRCPVPGCSGTAFSTGFAFS